MRKLIAAKMPVEGKKAIVTLLMTDAEISQIYIDSPKEKTEAGDIYVGHVDRVVENAGGAFVRFTKEETGYLPANRQKGAVFVTPKKNDVIKAGDELIVRIETEQRANKQAVLNCALKGTKTFVSEISEKGKHRPYGTCLYKAKKPWQFLYEKYKAEGFDRIVTDVPSVCEEIGTEAVLYEDSMVSLYKLYNLSTVLDRFFSRKVWLPGGGYITVEQTEAFVCIDVNSAKASRGKNREEYLLQVNKEALKEAARQIRCRQLSGTILIDLITQKEESVKEELLSYYTELAKEDPVFTRAVDITPLFIMEITRHKVKKTLREQTEAL